MPITWKLEMTKVENSNKSLEQSLQFEVDTIEEAKEEADNIIKQNTSPLSGEAADFEWMLDEERNRITKAYFPQRKRDGERGIEIVHLPQWYVTIEPLGISLSEKSDYAETQHP